MPKRSIRPPKDENVAAAQLVALVTRQGIPKPIKNPAAVTLGRLGGLKGGPARAAKVSKKRLSEIGREGAKARWKKPG